MNRAILNQLWVFYNVALHNSFSLAAQALFMTQPGISTQIKLLENYYEVKLFERYGKKIKLTNTGEILFSYTERIFNLIQESGTIIEDIKGGNSGNLKISASLTMGTYYIPNIISVFKKNNPHIEIQMSVGNSGFVIDSILSFKTDLGFLAYRVFNEKLVIKPFMEEELVMIAAPHHPLVSQKNVDLRILNGQSFIMREKGSATREEIEAKFKSENIEIKVVMELGSTEAIKYTVEAGLGISIVPAEVVRREVEANLLKVIRFSDKKFTRKFYIAYHKDKHLSHIINHFLETALELIDISKKNRLWRT
jgi:LysR family transcriptional regulator, transcriptional activator of the cysJI operon